MGRINKDFLRTATPDTIVRTWYHKAYPTDPEWKSLEHFTFYDVFELLDNYYNPEFGDSILRERIFQELANVMDVECNYIYDQWINCKRAINMTKYDLGHTTWDEFINARDVMSSSKKDNLVKESYFNGYKEYDKANKNYDDVYYQFYYLLDELYCDGELSLEELRDLKNGSDELLVCALTKISGEDNCSVVNNKLDMNQEDKEFYTKILQDAAKNYIKDLGVKESWRETATPEDIERFRNRHSELKGDTKRKHGWLYFPRSSEDIIADSQDKVADQVYDFIESHKQYFAPDSGIYNRGHFYIEKKFNSGMGRTRLCKIDPKTKTIHLTNVANRFDIKYLEESFPKYKIEKDDKYSPWDRKSW